MTSNATRQARRAYAREFVTLRDHHMMQDRIEYAMHAPEVGVLGHNPPRYYAYIDGVCVERRTREQIAALLIKAWDNGIKTGA
jgi:hypothetical protein